MAVEQKWVYERVASGGDADGRRCVFCGQVIIQESQPVYWVKKADEDNQDADFILEEGYAHHACGQKQQQSERRGSLTLPEVPDLPRH